MTHSYSPISTAETQPQVVVVDAETKEEEEEKYSSVTSSSQQLAVQVQEQEEEEEEEEAHAGRAEERASFTLSFLPNKEQNISFLQNAIQDKTVEKHLALIDRMGKNLRIAFDDRANAFQSLGVNLNQVMDDYSDIKRLLLKAHDMDLHIYAFMIREHFDDEECDASVCPCIHNNRRNRNIDVLSAGDGDGDGDAASKSQSESVHGSNDPYYYYDNQHKNKNINNINNNNKDTIATDADADEDSEPFPTALLNAILDVIHVSLLHGFDTGYKLYMNERTQLRLSVQKNQNEDDEDEEANEDANENENESAISLCIDHRMERLRQIMNDRNIRHQKERQNGSAFKQIQSQNKSQLTSKFVTVVAVVDDNEDEQQQQPQKRSDMLYKFGYKFYYWLKFKNNEAIDEHYNNGVYPYSFWFIDKKYESMKHELMNNNITLHGYEKQLQRSQAWMNTKYVKQMNGSIARDYGVDYTHPILLPHILSLQFHCNFTQFCTLFSRAFRKLSADETDAQLKERNSNLREFARHLIECVHGYGTETKYSQIPTFFHGISIVMHFVSAVARFCSPTSTTTAFSVAMSFGERGLVVELGAKNAHSSLTFFDCCVLSDFSNEEEKLFIQGGYQSSHSDAYSTALSFQSIRILELKHNYRFYIECISGFQKLINADEIGANSDCKLTRKHGRCLSFFMRENEKYTTAEVSTGTRARRRRIPEYVAQMWMHIMHQMQETVTRINFHAPLMNLKGKRFLSFRSIFCELYSSQEIEANRHLWNKEYIHLEDGQTDHNGYSNTFVQPIFAPKLDVFFKLFPKLQEIEIYQLPLTHKLIKYVLSFLEQYTQQSNMANNNNNDQQRNGKAMKISIRISAEDHVYKNQCDSFESERNNNGCPCPCPCPCTCDCYSIWFNIAFCCSRGCGDCHCRCRFPYALTQRIAKRYRMWAHFYANDFAELGFRISSQCTGVGDGIGGLDFNKYCLSIDTI